MYCRNCGKFIENDSDYCTDCAPKEAPVEAVSVEEPVAEPVVETVEDAEPVQPKKEGKVMDGFGPALTSTILGIVAFSIAYVAYLFFTMDGILSINSYGGPTILMIVMGVIFTIVAIALAIPSLVMGIKSIKLFKSAVANNRAKPIPALILGIYGTVQSASSFLMVGSAFLMLMASILERL